MDPEYFKSYAMSWGTLGTVRPFPSFHPDSDAQEIRLALEKKDAATLVRILTNRSNAQRQALAEAFQNLTQKNLVAGVKKALSGDLETLLLDLLTPPLEYEAVRLRRAMAGLGTDEEALMEILCTRSGKQLRAIAAAYNQLYQKDLEKDLKGETSGDFAKLLTALLNKENLPGALQGDVQSLCESLKGKKASAGPWINVLTSRDSEHLQSVLMALELRSGRMLDEALEKHFSADIRMGLRVLVQCIQSPDVYLARRLATMETAAVRGIMVSHSEEDLLCIRAAFLKLTGCSLYTALQRQFKGDLLQALLALCRSED